MKRTDEYMKALVYGSVGLALAVFTGSGVAAEISGKVTLSGTAPAEKKLPLDPICGKMNTGAVTTRHYVVGKDKGLADVFVYITEGAKATPAKGEAPMLDQVACMYTPYIWGVVAGQKFKVRNSDAVLHNVHATPKINKEFNIGQPLKGQVSEMVFDKPEVLVRVKCDVHPWMFTYVGVVEHPYFAVTDEDGMFKIPDLPAGKYKLEVTHRKAGKKTQEFTVGQDEKKTLDFTLAVP